MALQSLEQNFDVDIRGPSLALLPVLAFESATRRNRPNLDVSTAIARYPLRLAARMALLL